MSQVVIENPIINSPFDEPTRHFRFTDEGITNEEVDGVPIRISFPSRSRKRKASSFSSIRSGPKTASRRTGSSTTSAAA
jgi:type III restriction enzyme